MSDTPQTDALVVLPSGYTNHIRFNHELVELARTLERELAAVTAERDTAKMLAHEHRLNKTLRAMWDGVRFAQKCNRDMKMRAALRQCREALATCRGGVEAIQAADKVLPP